MKIIVLYRDNHNHDGPFPYRNWGKNIINIVYGRKEFFKIRETKKLSIFRWRLELKLQKHK